MYKVPEEWKLSDFLELSNDEKLKWLYNGVKNGGGGSDLPEVTSDDNGDVLTVVEGAWAKATPSGGGVFQITDTYDSGEDTHTLNKTWQEIYTAFTSGYTCYVIVENVGGLSGVTDYNLVLSVESGQTSYAVISSNDTIYATDTASGYPVGS